MILIFCGLLSLVFTRKCCLKMVGATYPRQHQYTVQMHRQPSDRSQISTQVEVIDSDKYCFRILNYLSIILASISLIWCKVMSQLEESRVKICVSHFRNIPRQHKETRTNFKSNKKKANKGSQQRASPTKTKMNFEISILKTTASQNNHQTALSDSNLWLEESKQKASVFSG